MIELKDYTFEFDSLDKLFNKKDDKAKMDFCRQIKEGWNDSLKAVFGEVIRQFYKKTAVSSESFEETLYYRYALMMYSQFEKEIAKFSNYHAIALKKITKVETINKN